MALQGTLNHTLTGIFTGAGPKEAFSSPAFADVTGDSTPEIVVASMDGTVEAFRATDRSRLWTARLAHRPDPAELRCLAAAPGLNPDWAKRLAERAVWLAG